MEDAGKLVSVHVGRLRLPGLVVWHAPMMLGEWMHLRRRERIQKRGKTLTVVQLIDSPHVVVKAQEGFPAGALPYLQLLGGDGEHARSHLEDVRLEVEAVGVGEGARLDQRAVGEAGAGVDARRRVAR